MRKGTPPNGNRRRRRSAAKWSVDALAAAVGEGDVERGGRRGLVHLRSLSEDPTGNHPGTLGSGPPRGPRSSLTALTSHTLGPGQPGQPRPIEPTKPIQEDG